MLAYVCTHLIGSSNPTCSKIALVSIISVHGSVSWSWIHGTILVPPLNCSGNQPRSSASTSSSVAATCRTHRRDGGQGTGVPTEVERDRQSLSIASCSQAEGQRKEQLVTTLASCQASACTSRYPPCTAKGEEEAISRDPQYRLDKAPIAEPRP